MAIFWKSKNEGYFVEKKVIQPIEPAVLKEAIEEKILFQENQTEKKGE
jgi:hypothetical protein